MKLNQSCRGKEAKEALLAKYDIRPISYVKLLDGQKKDGCCGEITDRYYAFEFKDKDKNSNKIGGFFVGYVCGHEFLELLGIDKKKYPLFNPLKNLTSKDEDGTGGDDTPAVPEIESDTPESEKTEWDPLNKEVYNAIHLIVTSWSGAPYGDYANIINFIKRDPSYRVSNNVVKRVNYLISKDAQCRPLIQIVDELRRDYPSLKKFEFTEMSKIIEEMIAAGEVEMNYIE